jgi:hypothetical protein
LVFDNVQKNAEVDAFLEQFCVSKSYFPQVQIYHKNPPEDGHNHDAHQVDDLK